MIQTIKQNIILNIKNIPGWHTRKKIVVIECDDWGSVRVPSREIYDVLTAAGLQLNTGWHNVIDTLENKTDLEQLFEILYSVKDRNNKPAVMTPMTTVANPDFDKIKASGFSTYYYEPFTETLKKYYPGEDVFKQMMEGVNAGIFVPELHGREHITVQLWMDQLRRGNRELLLAFDHGFSSLSLPEVPKPAREFRAEFYFTSEDQKPFLLKSLKDGICLFKDIFGYWPKVFVPSNGIFHPDFEKVFSESSIKFLWVNHLAPYPVPGKEMKYRHFIPGQKGPNGLTYYTRNCAFEPNGPGYTGTEMTLKQISAAFRWGKPAIISSHRTNFVGGIDPLNRERGLAELRKLLKAIVRRWPEVEFMGSAEALEYMRAKGYKRG